ncbi:hypothetical protein [Streptomyces sp. NBC_00120]|uniref:Apea-like HEPN domain-containing protein n=1 Tax=Streptomyces sp. NBC_00119 TaxID=2975659 RepID=A0AAU1U1C5_9ACTN|nr:hypothetical protein [Streptomyces sp. NBC_00120]MCX5321819.1 hypothetical protein [Streptomyces sp. NBC_00120]
MYVLAYAGDYFSSRHSRIEFISFEYRVASLAWLRTKIEKDVDSEVSELRATRAAGTHRVEGWEGESDQALDESVFMLDSDIRQISAGVIIVAAVAALESLMNQMLDQPGDDSLHRAGLTRKAHKLATRWSAAVDSSVFDEHVGWLRERRNSFAHRLIDDVDPQWRNHVPDWDFDGAAADEALVRVGEVAWMLEEGWEQQLQRAGR